MPNSLRCKIKHMCHNGTLTERERDRILNALEQEPKWIPVSERLPEEDGTYLVSELVYSSNKPRGYGYEPTQNIVDFVEFSAVNGWRRATALYEITAWMPLPEPYKESEVEDADSD